MFKLYSNQHTKEDLFQKYGVLEIVRSLCRRKFSKDVDRLDDCCSFVIEKILEDNCKRLQNFENRSSFKTFIFVCVNRLIVDYVRQQGGRKRFPQILVNAGRLEKLIYSLFCWEEYSVSDVYECVCCQEAYVKSYCEFIQEFQSVIDVPCHKQKVYESLTDADGNDRDIEDTSNNPLELLLEKQELEQRIKAGKIIREATKLLSEADQMLVRLVYAEDIALAKAASSLGLPLSTARARLKKIFLRYRQKLLENGIGEP